MTLKFGFYNSVAGDRKYDATDFAKAFDAIMEDGVIRNFGTEFSVTALGGLNISVGIGHSWFLDTYLLNDDILPMTLGAAEVGGTSNRIDSIVLEFDASTNVRANTIRIIKGSPATSPVPPTLVNTATLKQVSVANIYRTGASSSVSQSNITKIVGTPATPYSVSRLLDRSYDPASMHRNVFRGKYLGNAYTAAQKLAVSSGSFDDLYVGDYWTINGVNWRIVDINYYKQRGDVKVTTNHLVIMPDTTLRDGKMYEDFNTANSGAYQGCNARSNHYPAMISIIQAAFGSANMLVWRQMNTSSISNGKPSGNNWYGASMEIPNQIQIFGSMIFNPDYIDGNTPAGVRTEANTQFSLFRLMPEMITVNSTTKNAYWTRDCLSPVMFAGVDGGGLAQYAGSTTLWSFRTIHCLM